MAEAVLLPPGTRLLHIGPHKTGTTAVQAALAARRAELPAHGVVYPGHGTRDRRAGWALGLPGRPPGVPTPPIEEWERLARTVQSAGADVRVCVSNEAFGKADDATVERVVRDLAGESAHVVAVARRLDRYLPSQWQQRVKAGATASYDEWLRVVLGSDPTPWTYRNTWHAHDIGALVGRWTRHVGAERFTLVISDDSDYGLLPRTFERMLGLPDGFLRPPEDRSNRSLTYEEVELVRALNMRFEERGWSRAELRRFMRSGVLARLVHDRGSGRTAPPLPGWAVERVRQISDARVAEVRRSGVRVVGDPERLRVPADVPVGDPPPVRTVPLDLAAVAVEAAVEAGLRGR